MRMKENKQKQQRISEFLFRSTDIRYRNREEKRETEEDGSRELQEDRETL